jgi:hypothetical protein
MFAAIKALLISLARWPDPTGPRHTSVPANVSNMGRACSKAGNLSAAHDRERSGCCFLPATTNWRINECDPRLGTAPCQHLTMIRKNGGVYCEQ